MSNVRERIDYLNYLYDLAKHPDPAHHPHPVEFRECLQGLRITTIVDMYLKRKHDRQPRTLRFWTDGCKISLRDGQSLTHCHGGPGSRQSRRPGLDGRQPGHAAHRLLPSPPSFLLSPIDQAQRRLAVESGDSVRPEVHVSHPGLRPGRHPAPDLPTE